MNLEGKYEKGKLKNNLGLGVYNYYQLIQRCMGQKAITTKLGLFENCKIDRKDIA